MDNILDSVGFVRQYARDWYGEGPQWKNGALICIAALPLFPSIACGLGPREKTHLQPSF